MEILKLESASAEDIRKLFAEPETTELRFSLERQGGIPCLTVRVDGKTYRFYGAEALALEHGLNHLGTWCIREIEPYIKFFNAEIERVEELPDGLKRYHCRFKDTGKPATCSPRFRLKNGNIGYMVTWEI